MRPPAASSAPLFLSFGWGRRRVSIPPLTQAVAATAKGGVAGLLMDINQILVTKAAVLGMEQLADMCVEL